MRVGLGFEAALTQEEGEEECPVGRLWVGRQGGVQTGSREARQDLAQKGHCAEPRLAAPAAFGMVEVNRCAGPIHLFDRAAPSTQHARLVLALHNERIDKPRSFSS